MKQKYRQFIFKSYKFEPDSGVLKLKYAIDRSLEFTETYVFDFAFADYDPEALDRALQLLFFVAGVSYYKTYIPPEIAIVSGQVDANLAEFLGKTYQKGLGEFWYVNQLDPTTPVNFPITENKPLKKFVNNGTGHVIGIGGGKDSLVTVELLRSRVISPATWSLDHAQQLRPLVERIGLPHLWVQREWDKQLLQLNNEDALKGHIPISAIFASVGAVVAVLAGKRDIVVSNEQSTNEPTLRYRGVDINHQYSKSIEFEIDFQNYLHSAFGDSLRYYSMLRPLSEVRIAELFASIGFNKYVDVFSSCNRAFVHTSNSINWCGICPKCAFVFLVFTPFIGRQKLENLFHGKNLLLDPELEPMYRQLLGMEGNKPLECVGEIKETRMAMIMAQKIYPELSDKYRFDPPHDYDFRALGKHSIPNEMYEILQNALQHV